MSKTTGQHHRIAVDGNEANIQHRVGSNVYAYEVLTALEKLTKNNDSVSVTVLLSSPAIEDLPPARSGWRYEVVTPQPLWTQIALPTYLFLHASEYDVFYTPGHYAPRYSAVPYVSSVMDLGFLKFPDQFKRRDYAQLKNWTSYSVKYARKIIAISEATKVDVVVTYHRKPEDVVVGYPSISGDQVAAPHDILQKFMETHEITSPFILYVGTLQPRKNLVRLVKAFEEITSQWNLQKTKKIIKHTSPLQLVIAGKVGWLADEVMDAIENSPFKSQIVVTGYVSDGIKYGLYGKANCTVLVGLYEGFGIPPLESLAKGTIPVVSDTMSLPEVVGEAGVLVDPYSVDAIAQGLLKVLSLSAKQRGLYRRKGREQLAKFSWDKTAEIVLDTILSVAQKS